jgi:hypothetical protein
MSAKRPPGPSSRPAPTGSGSAVTNAILVALALGWGVSSAGG